MTKKTLEEATKAYREANVAMKTAREHMQVAQSVYIEAQQAYHAISAELHEAITGESAEPDTEDQPKAQA